MRRERLELTYYIQHTFHQPKKENLFQEILPFLSVTPRQPSLAGTSISLDGVLCTVA